MSEFARTFTLDTIGTTPRAVAIEATPEECAALANRFDLIGIASFSATATLTQEAMAFLAEGKLRAMVTQRCVATGGPVSAKLDEPFAIRFVAGDADGPAEIELDSEDCDTMAHDGQAIDLGEAASQTLALALDPFPRAPDADAVLAKAGVVREDDHATGSFAALKGLMEKS